MKLLALDTSTVACSAALMLGDRVLERHEEKEREHTRLLIPMLLELLAEGEVELKALDALVLGNGPGSFIGLRIAAAVTQGLAFSAGLPVVPVSSMAAIAADVFVQSKRSNVAVTQDAHREEVYFGLYRRAADGLPELVGDERIATRTRLAELESLADPSCLAAGDGWHRYPDLAAANASLVTVTDAWRYPRARGLLPLARPAVERGLTIAPADVSPAYLRQRVAAVPRP